MAGVGGRVALKGSDGSEIVARAIALGARPVAGERASKAIETMATKIEHPGDYQLLTASAAMGEEIVKNSGLEGRVVYAPAKSETTADDTRKATLKLCEQGIDLLLFAGGDGTARDVLDALTEAGQNDSLTVIGIPAGCKIHSAVYAVTPAQAGELAAKLVNGQPIAAKMAEVMDLDEEAFRDNLVRASCYGYLPVPFDESRMQAVKQGGVDHEALALQDIAADIVNSMLDDCMYFIGAGSTTAAVMEELGLPNTLLGVDVVLNRELIYSDVDEKTILKLLEEKSDLANGAKIVVTAIGGQGHVFGRGNQQFSSRVIDTVGVDNIIVIATNEKLRSLNQRPLLVDTGDDDIDERLRGVKQIVTGFEQRTLYRIQ